MALVLKDRVRETSTTTGTGTFTLAGAVAGFQSFSAIGTGNTTYYTIATSSDWEVGIGTWTSPDQLSRDTILASTNGGAAVNFGSGTKDVFATFPAEGFAVAPPIGGTTPNTITGTTVTGLSGIVATGDSGQTLIGSPATNFIQAPDGTYWGLAIVNNVAGDTGFGLSVGDAGSCAIQCTDTNGNIIDLINFTGVPGNQPVFYNLKFPSTTGSNNQVLKTDGSGNLSWLDFGSPPAIGGTTPNTGKFTTVQSTVATGTAPFTVASTTNVANLNASSLNGATFAAPGAIGSGTASTGAFTTITASSNATLTAISDPSAPSNGNVAFYAKTFGGFPTLAARNSLNDSFGLQSALWQKNFQMWTTTTSANGLWIGTGGAGNGTSAIANPTLGGTKYQTIRRQTYANVITTTNQVIGVQGNQSSFWRGSVAGQGGFFFFARCGFDVWTNGARFFVGLSTGTTVISADPSALNNTVGFCVDVADNGAISFLTRGTAATKASTGYTITSNKGYDLYIYCAPNSSQYTWQIVDINAGTSASGTATANLPTNTQMQYPFVLASNAALTPATSVNLGVAKIYIESDY